MRNSVLSRPSSFGVIGLAKPATGVSTLGGAQVFNGRLPAKAYRRCSLERTGRQFRESGRNCAFDFRVQRARGDGAS